MAHTLDVHAPMRLATKGRRKGQWIGGQKLHMVRSSRNTRPRRIRHMIDLGKMLEGELEGTPLDTRAERERTDERFTELELDILDKLGVEVWRNARTGNWHISRATWPASVRGQQRIIQSLLTGEVQPANVPESSPALDRADSGTFDPPGEPDFAEVGSAWSI
jgi:hypothetical protein